MPGIRVEIKRIIDTHPPGFVECQFVDVHGRNWTFIEKIPIVTTADIWVDSEYPQSGVIDGEIIERRVESGGEIVVVNTTLPDGVESIEGTTRFEVGPDILVE
jgi:hypothetical protein